MPTTAEHNQEAEAHVLYEKNKATKIATITFKRLSKKGHESNEAK